MAQGLFDAGKPAKTRVGESATTQFRDVYYDWSLRPYDYPPYFSSHYLTQGSSQSFTVDTPNANHEAATVTLNLWSLTSTKSVSPDHAVQAYLNGKPLGQAIWSGGGKFVALTFEVPANVLVPGANTLDLSTPDLPNVSSQIALL